MEEHATASIGPRARECFGVALRLGLTAFGGPAAHIGYFEQCYVERRRWLDREEFAGMVALCQMVPGPASSQLGFLIGWRRAGWQGAVAAWMGFTLPSALIMMFLAIGFSHATESGIGQAVVHGFKLVAVAVLAQTIVVMARALCADMLRATIAGAAMVCVVALPVPGTTLIGVVLGAIAGAGVLQGRVPVVHTQVPISRRTGLIAGLMFAGLLALAVSVPHLAGHNVGAMAALFFRAGALVFGGGHVVLPLLHDALVPAGWVDDQTFLAGYGAVQAMPGPLFTLAAWLGAACAPAGAGGAVILLWSTVALLSIFLPGLMTVMCAMPLWQWLGHHARSRGALAGINAAVVGVLAAIWCSPVARVALLRPVDGVLALLGLVSLLSWRLPPVVVVGALVLASVVLR